MLQGRGAKLQIVRRSLLAAAFGPPRWPSDEGDRLGTGRSGVRRDFSGSRYTSDLKIGTPVATLPCAWHYRVSAETGRPGVSIL